MIIDDRPYITDPGELGNIIYVTAQKRGKNGNVKKRIALRIFGGTHTVEMIERLRRETDGSCITISIAAEPECEVVEHEREFLKIVKKMMK